ncbi:MAG: VWA domain-containing protein [Pyrinomonadaceae bacterium]
MNSDLVQTDVVVLNKQGHFVDGLTRDDFIIAIDGHMQPVRFFERVTVGSGDEAAQLALARGTAEAQGVDPNALHPLDRGRVVFFFVDDIHLSVGSAKQVRDLLRRFVETDLGQNDQMCLMSANGEIGFLQQLTDEKTVLRAAIDRLKPGPPAVFDYEQPRMSEFHALAIIDERDMQVRDFYAVKVLEANPGLGLGMARAIVEARARALLQQAGNTSARTLFALENAIRPAGALPGRKVVFFLSDGFYLNRSESATLSQLRRVANAAARAGVVIYSIDTRGLSTGWAQTADGAPADPGGALLQASLGAVMAAQDPLNALAADTGGRAFLNSNALGAGVAAALGETARYYLLAWQPDEQTELRDRTGQRIAVSVRSHSDYKVLVRRGYFQLAGDSIPRTLKVSRQPKIAEGIKPGLASIPTPTPTPATDPALVDAIVAPYPTDALPMALNLAYQDVPGYGSVVTALVQVDGARLDFEHAAGEPTAIVEVAGVVFNTDGRQVASFKNRLNFNSPADGHWPQGWRGLISQYNLQLPPGLYQMRAAARDVRAGTIGSAMRWIVIPDLAKGQLALASLQLSERKAATTTPTAGPPVLITPSVEGQFSAKSALRFRTVVYNAAHASGGQPADVVLQVQIFRDNQPVVTAPVHMLTQARTPADAAPLAYEAELPLATLTPGRYQLRVTALDRTAKTTATQQVNFEVR